MFFLHNQHLFLRTLEHKQIDDIVWNDYWLTHTLTRCCNFWLIYGFSSLISRWHGEYNRWLLSISHGCLSRLEWSALFVPHSPHFHVTFLSSFCFCSLFSIQLGGFQSGSFLSTCKIKINILVIIFNKFLFILPAQNWCLERWFVCHKAHTCIPTFSVE